MIPPALPPDELRRLQALHALCLLDTPPEERFERIVRTAVRLFRVPIALVSLVDADRQWFKARQGLEAPETPRSISFCGHAILTPDVFVVPDTHADPRFADNPLVTGGPHLGFYAGQPLHAPDGSRVGTLCLLDREPRAFSEADRAALADLAAWVELEFTALTVREARTALAQQQRFFELSVDMLGILGLDGALRRVSQAWTRTFHRAEEALLGSSLLELVHPEDREAVAAQLARAAGGASLVRFEHRCHGCAGGERWLQWNAVPHVEEGILYAVGRDVTEQKRLEAERRQVERMKDEFVSTVSHELRTPLTSIRGSLGLLAGGVAGPLPEAAADMVAIAHRNTERLLRLVGDILDLEKMESGTLDFHLEPQELAPLVRQSAEAHQGYAEEHGVRVEVEALAPGARAVVDAGRLLQVLANLLSNALKFSPRGGVVTLRLERAGERLRLSVRDRGPGVPEAFRARLFQRFAQADASDTRRRGGTGLGLSIARALVERMGGQLGFSTEEGVGTTFWLELPEAPEARSPSPGKEAPHGDSQGDARGR
jgi:PAS domain S-box-containing protein